jgi:HAD superfamily hydrolase (TIGR01459 family)
VMESIAGLGAIAARFDVFLIDQFGVLHNGREPYPGAAEALAWLKGQGKRVALVSNSAKRTASNLPRMRMLGFPADHYDGFITSGEAAFLMMRDGLFGAEGGKRAIVFALDDDRSFMAGTGLVETDDPALADLLIIAGSEAPRLTLDDYRLRLAPLAARNVPALCLNPDKLMLLGHETVFAPGAIADLYGTMGGGVRWVGKPYADIYRVALDAIGAVRADRILCIGDSIEHDIAGAKAIGAASLFIRGGIFRQAADEEIAREIAAHDAAPDFIAPLFQM